jgi:shikimate kinase
MERLVKPSKPVFCDGSTVKNRLSNVILIGMSGAGKSTIGKSLARAMKKGFLDTDLLIRQREGRLLCEILETLGSMKFLELEDNVVRSLDVTDTVVATGGSIIYSPYAVEHLKKTGLFVYLDVPYKELVSRIGEGNDRGIVRFRGETLQKLYYDRKPMYQELADITIDCTQKAIREIVKAINSRCAKRPPLYSSIFK